MRRKAVHIWRPHSGYSRCGRWCFEAGALVFDADFRKSKKRSEFCVSCVRNYGAEQARRSR